MPHSRHLPRKRFVVATEGARTEAQYFSLFNDWWSASLRVQILEGRHDSSPPQVLKRMQAGLQLEGLEPFDEAWLVVDRNHWQDVQLAPLHAWAQKHDNCGFALSNPSFEYWLLLHFEDGAGIASPRDCKDRLRRYLPNYDKKLDKRKISRAQIEDAIRRARQRDNPPCTDWPRHPGGTTVYRLVERILKAR